jgi:DNA-binding transcriptional ArsR family regulator
MPSAELLLHRVRLRVIEALLGDRKLTTAQLHEELPDVPLPSLYRHVARLVEGGVVEVVGERRVRGAVERTLVLRGQPRVGPDAAAAMSIEDHRGAFVGYIAALLGDFDRYLAGGDVDLARDGVVYRIAALWLDDEELQEMARGFVTFIQPWLDKPATPARTRRILRTVLLPGGDARRGSA